jgi:hypothetical protein
MSLPLAFNTVLQTIPGSVPYLGAAENKKLHWRKLLGIKTALRVGLAWSGSINNMNDRNRSIPLQQFERLLCLPIEFHALQKDINAEDALVLRNFEQLHLHHDELADFSDTAALISELDLVISVDTSVAHLAGALGKPVWVLLPFAPDFRWLTDRQDSPWYPTARIFRQTVINDWNSVMIDVADNLNYYG